MTVESRLQRGSFRGVKFFIRDDSTGGGRKQVIYEFPNSDSRGFQDQGLLKKTFTLNVVTFGSGSDYYTNRDQLIAALEAPGAGPLIHPFFSGIKNVISQSYKVDQATSSLGEARFSLTFTEVDQTSSPTNTSNNASAISDSSSAVSDSVSNDISDGFDVSNNFPDNFEDAADKLNDISNSFEDVAKPFQDAQDSISDFQRAIDNFQNDIYRNINAPSNLANQVQNMFNQADNIGPTAQSRFNIAKGFFGFGASDTPFKLNTPERVQRQDNRNILNMAMNTYAIANAYQAASQINFMTETDLNITESILENHYQNIIQNNKALSDETINLLTTLRVQSRQYFDGVRLDVARVQTITTPKMPLLALTYQYYGDLDNLLVIQDLNHILNPGVVSGELQILRGGSNANN